MKPVDMEPRVEPWSVTLPWLIRLRWMASAGELAAVILASVLGVSFNLGTVLALVAVSAASNGALSLWTRRGGAPSDRLLAGVLLLDVVILTALLALTGGPSNPFSVIYLVEVALAAMSLGPRWAWSMVAASAGGYAVLFLLPHGAGDMHMMHHGPEPFPNHLQGMWLAFGVAASMITYSVTRIASEMRSRGAEIQRLERRAALNDKLASLSTLAAGAAHELGTPLSTIALVAKEMETAASHAGSSALHDDAVLIRAEVDRCTAILRQLSADAGQTVGELPETLSLVALKERLGESLTRDDRQRVVLEVATSEASAVQLPSRTIVQVVRNLVRNALEASEAPVRVTLQADEQLEIRVDDRGAGMAPEVLAKAGEPFFTTKAQGRGLGLGLFLARAVAERLGGSLRLQSQPGIGTTASLTLPLRPAGMGGS